MGSAEAVKATVRGFLTPVYSDHERGIHTFENPLDFELVRLGYACANCLAYFDQYVAVCPACGNERDVAKDMAQTPTDWQAFYEEETGPGEATVPIRAHEAIEQLAVSPDVEHIPLDRLKPSKWGRGK